jgi:hypothetical protein
MSQKKLILSRRNFLLTAGAGGVASAAALVTRPKGVSPEKSPDKRATQGYQVTEHVNRYYRTAKV